MEIRSVSFVFISRWREEFKKWFNIRSFESLGIKRTGESSLLFSFSSFLSFFRIEWSTAAAAAAGQAKKERWRWDAWINVTSSSVRPSLYPPDLHPPPSSMWHRTPVCTAPSSDNQQLNRWRMSSSPPTTSDNSARFFFSPFFLRSKKMYFFISAARASLSLARYSWGFFLSIFFSAEFSSLSPTTAVQCTQLVNYMKKERPIDGGPME